MPGRSVTAKCGLFGEHRNDVGSERADLDVSGAFAEFEGANDGVGYDAKAELAERRGAFAVCTG